MNSIRSSARLGAPGGSCAENTPAQKESGVERRGVGQEMEMGGRCVRREGADCGREEPPRFPGGDEEFFFRRDVFRKREEWDRSRGEGGEKESGVVGVEGRWQ